MPVSLEIIDDVIVEELYETIRINIAPTDGQQSLFSTGQYGTVTINIRDNDSKSIYMGLWSSVLLVLVRAVVSRGGCMWVHLHPIHAPVHPSYACVVLFIYNLSQYVSFTILPQQVM